VSWILTSVAILTGAALAVYSVDTACDPYWSPPTRMIAILGAGVGAGVVALGFWGMTL
jgi:hypothetical protein